MARADRERVMTRHMPVFDHASLEFKEQSRRRPGYTIVSWLPLPISSFGPWDQVKDRAEGEVEVTS